MASDVEYRTVAGFVQFDPETAEVNNQELRRLVVQATGSEGSNVTVSLWPEWADVEVNKGDFIVANGKFEAREGKDKVFLNLTAYRLVVIPGAEKGEVGTTEKGKSKSERPF